MHLPYPQCGLFVYLSSSAESILNKEQLHIRLIGGPVSVCIQPAVKCLLLLALTPKSLQFNGRLGFCVRFQCGAGEGHYMYLFSSPNGLCRVGLM